MLNKFIFVIIIAFSRDIYADAAAKISIVKEAANLSSKIVDIAIINQSTKKDSKFDFDIELSKLYKEINDVRVLAMHSDICFLYISGHPEDHVIDDVFEMAWKKSIQRIGEIGGGQALSTLKDLNLHNNYDGAFSLWFNSIISKTGNP